MRTIGALNVFQGEGRARLSDADTDVAQGFADAAAISLIHDELAGQAEATVGQLSSAMR